MQIFYFRKNTLKWIIAIVVVAILAIVIWGISKGGAHKAQDTLMLARVCCLYSHI